MVRKLIGLMAIVTLAAGCATNIDHLPIQKRVVGQEAVSKGADDISVQFLGVGGFLLRYQDVSVVTGPSFTNPGILGFPPAPFQPVKPNAQRIDKLMPDAKDASVMLVGHAHYDHLLDVPYVLNNQAPNAKVYGSKTMKHTIASEVSSDRIEIVNDSASKGAIPGEWLYDDDRKVRVMAITAEHSPHFMGLKFLQGTYDEDLPALPWDAHAWLEGQTFAWLVDFLDESGKPVYRVHYQDAACNSSNGRPPELADNKRVDLSLQTVGAYQEVDDYPEGLVTFLRPRVSVLGHWEDFFGNNPEGPHKPVMFADIDAYIERLERAQPEDASWVMPEPFAVMNFPVLDR